MLLKCLDLEREMRGLWLLTGATGRERYEEREQMGENRLLKCISTGGWG